MSECVCVCVCVCVAKSVNCDLKWGGESFPFDVPPRFSSVHHSINTLRDNRSETVSTQQIHAGEILAMSVPE